MATLWATIPYRKVVSELQPWSQGLGKKSFYTHFAPPHPCAMLAKHVHLTQVCILPFSNIERGNGGVDTYSVGIAIIISCFWHFPTQFVQGCSFLHESDNKLAKSGIKEKIEL